MNLKELLSKSDVGFIVKFSTGNLTGLADTLLENLSEDTLDKEVSFISESYGQFVVTLEE